MRRVTGSVYWPHTRLHRKGMATDRQIRMRGTLKGLAAYLVVFLFFALGYVWTRIQVLETGYQLRYLEDVREKLREENRSLMVEAATLKSPQRLETVALDIGLKPPAEHQVKFLKGTSKNSPSASLPARSLPATYSEVRLSRSLAGALHLGLFRGPQGE